MSATKYVASIRGLCLMAGLAFSLSASSTPQIWWEAQIGRATIGFDVKHQQWNQVAFYIGVISEAGVDTGDKLSQCLNTLRDKEVDLLTKEIKGSEGYEQVVEGATSIDPTLLPTKSSVVVGAHYVESLMRKRVTTWNEKIGGCTGRIVDPKEVMWVMSLRYCGPSDYAGKAACRKNGPAMGGHEDNFVFRRLYDWVTIRSAQGVPTLGLNETIVLPTSEQAIASFRKLPQSAFKNTNLWQVAPAEVNLRVAFEDGVERIRNNKLTRETSPSDASMRAYGDNVLQVLRLPKEVGVRLLDALYSPKSALERVANSATVPDYSGALPAKFFAKVSDEIARTRAVECAKFRGLGDSASSQEIAACTGYKFTIDELRSCLRGMRCLPDFADTGYASVMLIAEPMNRKALSAAALLPRLPTNITILVDNFNDCSKQNRATDLSSCLVKKQFSTNAALKSLSPETVECLSSGKSQQEKAKCAVTLLAQQSPLKQIVVECTTGGALNSKCMMERSFEKALSSDLLIAKRCSEESKNDRTKFAECLALKKSNVDPKLVANVECLRKARDAKQSALEVALCVTPNVGDENTRRDIALASGCYRKYSDDAKKVAGCVAASKISIGGDAQKVLQCFAESAGSALSTAVCLADIGANAETQIALQCLETTSGEPVAFLGCTAGQLTVKELMQCKGKKFGEEPCFGQGNTFRKIAKDLLGAEIGPNSLVAQAANAQLSVINFQVDMAQAVAENGGRLLESAGKAVERSVGDAGMAAEKAAQATQQAASQAAQKAAEEAARVAAEATRIAVEQRAKEAAAIAARAAAETARVAKQVADAADAARRAAEDAARRILPPLPSCCRL